MTYLEYPSPHPAFVVLGVRSPFDRSSYLYVGSAVAWDSDAWELDWAFPHTLLLWSVEEGVHPSRMVVEAMVHLLQREQRSEESFRGFLPSADSWTTRVQVLEDRISRLESRTPITA